MEIGAEKTKLMLNSASGIQSKIKLKGQKLSTVTNFKYLGTVVLDDGSKPEILSRIAQATAEANFERQHHIFRIKGGADFTCHFHIFV